MVVMQQPPLHVALVPQLALDVQAMHREAHGSGFEKSATHCLVRGMMQASFTPSSLPPPDVHSAVAMFRHAVSRAWPVSS